jgi:Rho termination factor, N-terminal domain
MSDELQAAGDLSRLTAAELYRRAQAAGIAGRSSMTKSQLIEALRGNGP